MLIVKVADEEPPGTVRLAGTVALLVLELDKETTIPAAGALPVRVTVPVEDEPPVTLDGLTETADSAATGAGGFTVRLALRLTPL